MAIKITELTGTDWADGDVLYSQDLLDTFGAITPHVKTWTATGPFTHTGDTNWATATAFTLTTTGSSILSGISFEWNDQQSGGTGAEAKARVKISGSGMTDHYLGTKKTRGTTVAGDDGPGAIVTTDGVDFDVPANALGAMGGAAPACIMLPASDTTFTIEQKVDNSADTSSVQDIRLRITYFEKGVED